MLFGSVFFPLLPPPIISGRHRLTYHLHPLLTSFTGTERRPTVCCSHPPPASLRFSLCAPHRMPSSAFVYRVVFPPVVALGLHPGPCRPLGVHPLQFPPYICVPPPSLCADPLPVIFWALVLWVSFLREDEGPGRLHSLEVARPGPRPPWRQ